MTLTKLKALLSLLDRILTICGTQLSGCGWVGGREGGRERGGEGGREEGRERGRARRERERNIPRESGRSRT
jgi:hypothetical protein